MHHICHISTTFNQRSGSARRTTSILQECVQREYTVSLIVGRDHDISPGDLPGVSIYSVPQLVKYVNPRLDIIAPIKITQVLKRIAPDMVHTHLAKGGILGRTAAKLAGVPYTLHTVHGPTFPEGMHLAKRTVYRGLEKICGNFTDAFVFVGEELRQSYINAGICRQCNSHVIRTGRPDDVLDRRKLDDSRRRFLRDELGCPSEDDFLVVSVGRIVPAKQFDHAVHILSRIRREEGVPARLVIVGKSLLAEEKDYEMKIRQLANDLGVEEFVFFVGFRKDVIDIMDASDAVLLTSLYEGLPNVAVEALIADTPMVTYNVSGVREVLQHIPPNSIIDPGNIGKAVAALVLLSQQKCITPAGLDGGDEERKRILDSFRECVMLRQKMSLYEQVFKAGETDNP